MTDSRSKREAELYEAAQGRPPSRLPDDHPDAWQWAYRGGKSEFEELQQKLGLVKNDGGPVKIDGQEELFGS
jgi:hypothetical protein